MIEKQTFHLIYIYYSWFQEIIANEHINNAIENIRCEIEIRVESLKTQLDELNQQFQQKLNEIKNDIIRYVSSLGTKANSGIIVLKKIFIKLNIFVK